MSSRLGCKDCDVYCDQHVNHQHILLQGALNAMCRVDGETKQKEHVAKIRKASYTQYSFRGVDVCRKFFMFVFGCGIKKLRNVKSHFLKNGVEQRSHQNTSLSSKCFSVECRIKAVTFIKNFSAQNALILPGRLPAYRLNTDLNILPCSMSKLYVFDLYKKAADETDIEIVGKTTWYDLWNTFCANIVIQKPRTDLCNVCQKQTVSLGQMQGLTEEEKREKINESPQHLDNITTERAYYNTTISKSLEEINNACFGIRLGQHEPRSYSGQMHYSFDFAQQISLPYSSQQVGALYFLAGYKVALFGVAAEPLKQFVLYVIPESCNTGKGSNVVISLLHHFFENFGIGETDVICHADNCCGQNKNNYLLQYAAWRIANGLHDSFQLSFLPVGHTKFSPDLYFGLFKKRFRSSDSNNLEDILSVAASACQVSDTIMAVSVGTESGEVKISSYDWSGFFKQFFPAPVKQLLSYNHFVTDKENLGEIKFKLGSQNPQYERVKIFKHEYIEELKKGFPTVVNPQGISIERQKYLYEKIRPFVQDDSKDVLCPNLPAVQISNELRDSQRTDSDQIEQSDRAKTQQSTENSSASVNSHETVLVPSRKRPRCGYCNEIGHRNSIRNGIPLCPVRKLSKT